MVSAPPQPAAAPAGEVLEPAHAAELSATVDGVMVIVPVPPATGD